MKIILRADVESLGDKGTILDVADGYARNFLIPKGFAMRATRGAVKQAADMARAREAAEAQSTAAANEAAAQLRGQTIQISAKVGEGGKLFGSVGSADVASAITDQTGIAVDRKQVSLDQPIKEIGAFSVPVQLHKSVSVDVAVEVAGA